MKKTCLATAFAIALLIPILSGCAGNPMSEEALQSTVEDIIAANASVETAAFDLTIKATVEARGADGVERVSVSGAGSGVVDNANMQMHVTLRQTQDVEGEGAFDTSTEVYVADDWMYIGVALDDARVEWMKMRMPDGMWQRQSQIGQQVELLKAADEVNYLGKDDVNGIECYVVEIVPSMDSVRQMMQQVQGQMSSVGSIDLGNMDLAQMVKQVSMTQYIAVDTYLFMRTEEHMLMEVTPEALGVPNNKFDVLVEEITTILVFRDYNEPATIQMPQGALTATQIGA